MSFNRLFKVRLGDCPAGARNRRKARRIAPYGALPRKGLYPKHFLYFQQEIVWLISMQLIQKILINPQLLLKKFGFETGMENINVIYVKKFYTRRENIINIWQLIKLIGILQFLVRFF